MNIYKNKTVGSVLLVAGTTIGAGMLAIPITTGVGGFFYSAVLIVFCYLYMLLNLFLVLESNLWVKDPNANIISITGERLGPLGQLVAWISFLMLLYAVAAAYLSGGGSLLAHLLQTFLSPGLSNALGIILFALLFGSVIYFGTRPVDLVNRFLVIGLLIAYFSLLFFMTPHVQMSHLVAAKPQYLWATVPVIVLSFTSHIIVPSLRTYLQNDIKQLKRALLLGSMIPLAFYLVWELLTVGMLPSQGEFSLAAISSGAHPVMKLTEALRVNLGLSWVAFAVGSFSFFALVTSFIGVVLSLTDFLADGLSIRKTRKGRLVLLTLTLVPPLIFAFVYPKGFVLAISYAGVFVAILYGILPVLMVWKGRYIEKLPSPYRAPGGKIMLVLMFMAAVAVIGFQVAAALHLLPTMHM